VNACNAVTASILATASNARAGVMRRMHAPPADSAGVATAAEREPAQSVMARRRLVLKTEIIISAVWLRRSGDNAEVLVERDGKWYKAITELADNNYSHIAEGNGAYQWTPDDL
jgi:hypothetical protein